MTDHQTPALKDDVGGIVPPNCTGYSFALDPGVMHVRKDGSGYIVVDENDFVLEDDRCEGPDGPEGSIHWIVRLDANEITALRDFLNGAHEDHVMPWLDIATAPKGTEILVWNGRRRHVAHWDRIESAWVSSYKTTTKRIVVLPTPTHWQPLPAEPATKGGQP